MPGNMPPPGQRVPLGSMQPSWQNIRPPAGNLPPENTPISFNHSMAPDMGSLADTVHSSSAPLLHHAAVEGSATTVSAATGATSAVATGELASGVVDASVAAGAAVGGGVQQFSAHACATDAAHSAACVVASVQDAQITDMPMHANDALQGMVAAVADALSAAGHMLA